MGSFPTTEHLSRVLVPKDTTMGILSSIASLVISSSVVSGKLIHAHPEVVQGHGFAAPPPGHHPHPPRQEHTVRTVSQFDQPGGFQPGGNPYAGLELGPTTEQVFVAGPPLGDDFLSQYKKMLENAQLNSKLTFEGLMLSQLEDRKQKRHQNQKVPTFVKSKPPVTLDYNSASLQSSAINNEFSPNGKWYGEKQRDLLTPKINILKRNPVELEFVSPSIGSFTPNGRAYGDKIMGLMTEPNYVIRDRPQIIISNPAQIHGQGSFSPNENWFGAKQTNLAKVISKPGAVISQEPLHYPSTQESPGSFSPSSWLEYRQRAIETGTRQYSTQQTEPAVITLDNINQFTQQDRPEVFDVQVQAVLRTRGAQPRV